MRRTGNLRDALPACLESIRLEPEYGRAYNVLGGCLCEMNEFRQALVAFAEAVRLKPEFAEAHANYGRTLLSLGELEKGWPEHEWRRRLPSLVYPKPGAAWPGSDPFGHTMLLHGEGGLGNVIQWSRYAPIVANMGARVVVQCPERLVPLMRTLAAVWDVVPDGHEGLPVKSCDLHCPLMSVPAVLRTGIDSIPAQVPYLRPERSRLEKWRRELALLSGFKVGIAWKAEQSTTYGRQRSIPLNH